MDAKTLVLRAWHTGLNVTGTRTLHNRWRYGANSPRPNLRLTVAPQDIQDRYFPTDNDDKRIGPWLSGRVLAGDWDQARQPFKDSVKFRSCARHFRRGIPWDQTKAFPYGLRQIAKYGKYDDCRTKADLQARYASLDDLWVKTTAAGALPDRASRNTTARTGIVVHVDRDGQFLFGNIGFHRLAIAKLAQLQGLTVILGVVHPDAIASGAFERLLQKH